MSAITNNTLEGTIAEILQGVQGTQDERKILEAMRRINSLVESEFEKSIKAPRPTYPMSAFQTSISPVSSIVNPPSN